MVLSRRTDLTPRESRQREEAQSPGAFCLHGYLAWKSSDLARARGKEWKRRATVAEEEVRRQMHVEAALLPSYGDCWDGSPDHEKAFNKLTPSTALRRAR